MTAPGATRPDMVTPALKPGECLTADEFLRRYEAMPNVQAELIEGVVHMPSPLRWDYHATPHSDLMGWFVHYRAFTAGVRAGDNATLRLDVKNVHQPDGLLIVESKHGGRSEVGPDGYLRGSPELAAQVSASTASSDLNQKLRVFQQHEIQEYIVWRVLDQEIDWFRLRGNQYERLPMGPDGVYRSEVFPGLWLHVAAMISFEIGLVLQVLQQGIQSPEHAVFVKKLQDAAKKHQ